MVGLAAYSSFAISRMGRHPGGYLLITRQPGRSGYLLGLFGAATLIVVLAYLELSLLVITIWYFHSGTLTLQSWSFGSMPLLLNGLIVAAFVLLISPLVMATTPRLMILTVLVIMVSREADLFGISQATSMFAPVLSLVRAPLLPVVGGAALAIQQTIDQNTWLVLCSQIGILTVLLVGAVGAFERRGLILQD